MSEIAEPFACSTGRVFEGLEALVAKMMEAGWVAGLARDGKGRFIIFWTLNGAKVAKREFDLWAIPSKPTFIRPLITKIFGAVSAKGPFSLGQK